MDFDAIIQAAKRVIGVGDDGDLPEELAHRLKEAFRVYRDFASKRMAMYEVVTVCLPYVQPAKRPVLYPPEMPSVLDLDAPPRRRPGRPRKEAVMEVTANG